MENKQKNVVVPGEEIGVIEEFTPLGLTYERDGRIRSMIVGEVKTNKNERSIEVTGKGLNAIFPLEYSVVEGVVESSSSVGGIVRIYSINGKPVSSDLTGVLRSHERQDDLYKLGDVVRARVTSLTNRTIWLDISSPDTGVLKTRCSKCGGEVKSFPPNNIKCLNCGNSERRKLIGFKIESDSYRKIRNRNDKFKMLTRNTRYKKARRSFK
jgi:exosome complex RNA-binding protein Csl4